MAAYRREDDLVTCGMTACTPASAPGPTLGNEYGKPLLLPFYRSILKTVYLMAPTLLLTWASRNVVTAAPLRLLGDTCDRPIGERTL